MGNYNILLAELNCPRCGEFIEAEAECRFGDCSQMMRLRIGDAYPWVPGKQVQNGGRPAKGSMEREGYVECPRCGKDFFLRVLVSKDVIAEVEVDTGKLGMIPDELYPGMTRMFTVLDRFHLKGKGFVLTGTPFHGAQNCRTQAGNIVSVRRGDEVILRTTALGWEWFRNTWSPHRPGALGVMIGEEFAGVEIPENSEVWVINQA